MRAALLFLLVAALAACGDEGSDVARARAEQAREAAIDAGLESDVADYLGLAARGDTATYRVTYPGPTEGTELVVTNRPPDRRVDVVVDGETTETRLAVDGQAYECRPGEGCERTDAFVPAPGVFTEGAVEELRSSLLERTEDFVFEIQVQPVAGVEATCLVTRIRAGRERPELGSGGTICLAPSGAVLLVDRDDERFEALDYEATVDDAAFRLPDPGEG